MQYLYNDHVHGCLLKVSVLRVTNLQSCLACFEMWSSVLLWVTGNWLRVPCVCCLIWSLPLNYCCLQMIMEIWYRSCIHYRLKSHWLFGRLPWSYAAICNCPVIQCSVYSEILSTRCKPSVASWSAAWLAFIQKPNSLFSSTDTQARTPVSCIYLACRFSLTSVTQTLQCRPSWKDWWGCSVNTTCTIYDLLCLIL